MFSSIFSSAEAVSYTAGDIIVCSIVSVVLGVLIALIFHFVGETSKSYKTSLVILPLLVQAVIMMVNGNLGTSVAVLGAFSLVRFRSVPGNSKEICGVFFAMAVGLATAMGCLVFAATLTIVVGVIFIVCEKLFNGFNTNQKALRITIPENLDYTSVFDDIFSKYTKKAELINVKTTNMGSMFELKYMIDVKADINEKQMIDEIRCKNGNLTVICSHNLQQGEAL